MCIVDLLLRQTPRVRRLERIVEAKGREITRLRALLHEREALASEPSLTAMYECKICMEVPLETVLLPCGHSLACRRCTEGLATCPVCASAVESVTLIHIL